MSSTEAAQRIKALCENPHWTADRKIRIAELAQIIIENENKKK